MQAAPAERLERAGRGYPLAQRRVTPAEERALMRFASDGMALAMSVCLLLATERPERPWAEQVLPYALASMRLITPSGGGPGRGHKTKRAAVTAALAEYVRSRRRNQILKWRGQVDYFDDYDYKALRRRQA